MASFNFLFYIKPIKYIGLGDIPDDPMDDENYAENYAFESFMQTCTLEEFIQTLVAVFKQGYPDPPKLKLCLVDYQFTPDEDPDFDPLRDSDIDSIQFRTEEIEAEDGYPDYHLNELIIRLKVDENSILKWVKDELGGISYTENTEGNFTVLSNFSAGVFKEIWCSGKQLVIKLDQEKHVRYLW
ncbi:MAG: hypothetical protein H6581_30235 [Bacteroidia bacterium]|nr:hypothetical protein [Bacteroidia bacterium]